MSAQQNLDWLNERFREGRFDEVRKGLRDFRSTNVSRDLVVEFAALARRVGLVTRSLKMLEPIIHPVNPLQTPASHKEIATYATGLSAIGAFGEARALLESIAESETAEVQLALAFLHIHTWDYAAAVPYLQRYLLNPSVTEYQKTVARVNLAAAFSFLKRTDEVIALASELLPLTQQNRWNFLGRESLLILAQGYIQGGKWESAEDSLSRAMELSSHGGLPDFLLRKWRVLLNLHRSGPTADSIQDLQRLRTESLQSRAWETLRECDYYEGIITKNNLLLQNVFFGTPFGGYRQRILREGHPWLALPRSHVWQLNRHLKGRRHRVDLSRGRLGTFLAAENELGLRVMRTLCLDFYRPLKIGALFAGIYPDEEFMPFSSPGRVHTAITRTRAMLKEAKIPLVISCEKNEYSLISSLPCSLRVRTEYEPLAPVTNQVWLTKLRECWPYKVFSTAEAANKLGLSVHSARRLLSEAQGEQTLIRVGAGRSTLFRFAK